MLHTTIDWLIEMRIQLFAIVGSLILCALIVRLIKRKKLKEEYALLWLGFGGLFVLLSIFKPLLEQLARFLGIFYAPAALLLVLVTAVFFILIQFSVVISRLTEANKNLTQEVALFKQQIDQLNDEIEKTNEIKEIKKDATEKKPKTKKPTTLK